MILCSESEFKARKTLVLLNCFFLFLIHLELLMKNVIGMNQASTKIIDLKHICNRIYTVQAAQDLSYLIGFCIPQKFSNIQNTT